MRLTFLYITIENFGSFSGTHKLTLTNGSAGLNFLKGENQAEPRLGSNGAGKSTLWNALCWCLSGRTVNNLLSTDIRPWFDKGRTNVSIDFDETWGKEEVRHNITRSAGPNSLLLDGKHVEQDDIDKLIGMSFEVFRQTIMLGQGRPLFHDLTNSDKLKFLADVLDLDRWDRYAQTANTRASELNRELFTQEGELQAQPALIELLQKQIAQHQESHDNWEKDRKSKLKAVRAQVAELTPAFGKTDTNYAKASAAADLEATQLRLLTGSMNKASRAYQDAKLKQNEIEAKAAALQARMDEAQQQLRDLRKAKVCPTCNQPIKNQANLLKHRETIEGRIAGYMTEVREARVEDASKLAEGAKVTLDQLHKDHDEMALKLDKLEANVDHYYKRRTELEVQLKHAKAELVNWEDGLNPHNEALASTKRQLRKAEADVEVLQERIKTLKHSVETTTFWVKGFKDVRLFVLEDVLKELEFVTNSMLDDVGLVGWEVRYAVERETKAGTMQRGLITTVVPSPRDPGRVAYQQELNRAPGIKFASWSGGESQRLRLVGALALSQVLLERAGVDCNIEVLDEPTRGLSSEGVDDLCIFLADRAAMLNRTIWLVDHKAIESATFNKVVTVVKDRKGSHIDAA